MLDLLPARPSMLDRLVLQPAQERTGGAMPPEVLEHMCNAGNAFALVDQGRQRVYLIGGFLEVWPERAALWSLLDRDAGRHMFSIVRTAQRALRFFEPRFKRVEAYVDPEHEQGERLIRLLGFEREGAMRAFWRDHTYDLWARIR